MSANQSAVENADNPTSLAGTVVLTSALAPAFAVVFVALRFYTAQRILRTVHIDDWLILAALLFSIGFSIGLVVLVNYGLGYHREYLRAKGMRDIGTFMIVSVIPVALTSNLAPLFVKVSILRFYLRFSTSRRFDMAIYVLIFVVSAANLLGAFSFLFICQPIRFMWDYMKIEGRCIAMDPWYGWLTIFNCVTDGVVLLLPAWIIQPLRAGVAHKVALAAILGTGGFVVAVSVFRVVIVARGWGDPDLTYKFAKNYILSVIEVNVGIVCACAPCLRALVGRYIPSLLRLGERHDEVDLYTIPMSQVGQPLPGTPDERDEASSTAAGTSWRSKPDGSDVSSAGERRY